MMIKWKKVLAAGLGTAMLLSQTAYADTVIVPPPPFVGVGGSQTGNTGLGTGIMQPGMTGGQNSSTENQGGPGTSGGQSSAQNQGGPGAAGNQSSSQSGSSQTQDSALPQVKAEGAVLMDAATGKVLFGKNQDMQFYPASITKVMTALLVLERCSLNDTVTFSDSATTNLESGAVSLGISKGDQLTVEQCLYGLLLKSANEIGNGLAEHVAGSVSAFADLMNARARELGCKNTHFTNPHGLNDTAHKTTPYDMALIMRAALQNETFRKIDTTTSYEFPATKKSAAKTITMGHKMMYPTDSRYYEGIIGGKTGYTSKAGNTLVTGAERNGVRLIAVVMKASGSHYTDTIAMLDYGFANYGKLTGGSGEGQSGVATPGTGSQSGVVTPGTGSQSGVVTPGTGSQNSVVTPGTGSQNSEVTETAREHQQGQAAFHLRIHRLCPGRVLPQDRENRQEPRREQASVRAGSRIRPDGIMLPQTVPVRQTSGLSFRIPGTGLTEMDIWQPDGEIIRTDRIIILIRQREPWYQTGGFRMEEPGIT